MNRRLVLALALVLVWLVLPRAGRTATPAANLLPNPGFEEVADGGPAGWTYVGPDSARAVTWPDSNAHAGTRSIRFAVATEPRRWECDPVPVRGGRAYRLEWWNFAQMDAHSNSGGVRVTFYDAIGEQCGVYERRERVRGTFGWVRAWLRVTAPDDARKCVVALFGEAPRPTTGFVAFDDVSLVAAADREELSVGWGLLRGTIRVGDSDAPGYARLVVTGSDGKRYAPRESYPFIDTTFHVLGPLPGRPDGPSFEVALPPGPAKIAAIHGFEYAVWRDTVAIRAGEVTEIAPRLVRRWPMSADGWYGGDAHFHFVGHRSTLHPEVTPATIMGMARAEGLSWGSFKNASVADFVRYGTARVADDCIIEAGVEATSDFHGHFYMVNVRSARTTRFPGGLAAWPMAYDVWQDQIPAGATMAFAHPSGGYSWDSTLADVANPQKLVVAREWPLDLALGQSPALDILCSEGGHRSTLEVRDYYRALNCGFRFGVSASSDAYVDQGRTEPGAARTYVRADSLGWDAIAAGCRRGATFGTNGPLVWFTVNGAGPGDEVALRRGQKAEVVLRAASNWGLIRAEVVQNGQVIRTVRPGPNGEIGDRFALDPRASGWVALRVFGPKSDEIEWEKLISPEWEQQGIGQFAHTSPVYLVVDGKPMRPDPEAARYFVGWMDSYRAAIDHRPDLFASLERARTAQVGEQGRQRPASTARPAGRQAGQQVRLRAEEARQQIYDRIARARAFFEEKAREGRRR